MKLIEELRAEHELIEKVLGALRTYVTDRAAGGASPADGDGFVRFFLLFAGTWHHGREEDTLFRALTEHAELAKGSGPVRSLFDQHEQMATILEEIVPLLRRERLEDVGARALVDGAFRYSRALLAHIDAENSVLLPESAERLRRAGIRELPSRARTPEEERAREEGERLATAYLATDDPGAIRGEGCVICPSFGVTCRGLEQEWWTDNEWDTFRERQG